LSIYLKLAEGAHSYLLESVQGGERFGRYSFIGLTTPTRIAVNGSTIMLLSGNRVAERREHTNPMSFVSEFMARFKVPDIPGLPRFCGGLVGYFGYDTVRFVEPKLADTKKPDPLGVPDILLLLSEEIAIVDNLSGKLTLVVFAEPGFPGAWQHAQARLKELLARLRTPVRLPADTAAVPSAPTFEFAEEDFKAAVRKAKQYIVDGDIMQVVLSQRMSKPYAASPLALYRALRTLNPSPYMFFFDFGDFQVVGASPEILVRLEGEGEIRKVTVRPIAGTRKRGATAAEDAALAADLLADQKERAEHLQLLDLGRNDVGRVAKIGTVKVTDSYLIERYSHVMHIVSNVEGELKDDEGPVSVLKATFPAGTVSGAPKVRAMEIIDELEPTKRGIYAGAVGYLGFNGDMDLAIAIRTAVLKGGRIHVQAGAGIVADSDPDSEWQETLNKARAQLRAAEMAEAGLDTRFE
jgi:anthranilate synthase component 1